VEELDYSLGGLPQDFEVDIIPHQQKVNLKLQLGPFVITCIGLIIQKQTRSILLIDHLIFTPYPHH
jgi:hypothetical protein